MNKTIRLLVCICMLSGAFISCSQQKKVSTSEHFYFVYSFTPNNDGLNETYAMFPLPGVSFSDFYMSIYNQNLRVVFETHDIEASWNPGLDELTTPTGIYELQLIYTATTDGINYDDYTATGTIYLHR